MTLDDTLTASPDVIAREVGGEMVLMHLGSGTYFGLNPVGGRIWQLLDERSRTVADLAATITAEYEAPAEQVAADVLALADDLARHELVSIA